MKKSCALILSTFILTSNISAKESRVIKSSLELFQKGSYAQVLEGLSTLKETRSNRATRNYLMALSHNRLQNYDKAIPYFIEAIKAKSVAKDIYYEYGQALYANNDLTKARIAFKKSADLNYKKDSSIYYVAHVSQILEENKTAKAYYTQILNSDTADTALKQVARFQIGEVLLSMARENEDTQRLVKQFVLPQMDKAYEVDTTSSLAREIKSRKKEIEREFGLDPNILYNGKRISSKRWNLSFTQDLNHDSNISLTNDLPSSAASREESFVFKTKMRAGYDFIVNKRFIINPELNMSLKSHTNRDSETVKSEDNYDISPSLNTSFEHKAFNKPASLFFNIDYNYNSKYNTAMQRKAFYSRSTTYTIGEKFKFFSKGDTSLKFKYKDLSSHTSTLFSKTKSFSVDQLYLTSSSSIYMFLLSYDSLDTYNNPKNATNSTLLRVDYIKPNILPKITLHVGASVTFVSYTDANESSVRGTEKTITPSIKLTKKINDKLKFSVGYNYTKNTSLKADYDYTKHVTSSSLKYTF
ncbi:tetratricopeptide repeat protein [Halobacteriovorax marinus]|uniref:tetratricopeptide repeat protein n=1 Tax=Halobacteriovorax marinus TaxID=97084 RepID=UPI003A8FBC52